MRDLLGNELAAGDLVHVKYGNEWIGGLLVKVQSGGLSLGIANPTQKNGRQTVTPDIIVLQVTIPLGGDPRGNQPFIVRLDTKAQVEGIIESSLKM